jgi:hypothetical protein
MSMIFLATLLMASAEPVVPAEPVEEKNLISGKVKRDPARGYIFLHGEGRQLGAFIRVPDKEDITAYEADRQKAYDKEKKRYAARLARWPQDVATATQLKKSLPKSLYWRTMRTFRSAISSDGRSKCSVPIMCTTKTRPRITTAI